MIVMLPPQWTRPGRIAEPQKRLMAAVLHAVIDDCRGGSLYRRSTGKGVVDARDARNAMTYVASTDRTWPFSFENLCEVLGLDVTTLRNALIAMSLPA